MIYLLMTMSRTYCLKLQLGVQANLSGLKVLGPVLPTTDLVFEPKYLLFSYLSLGNTILYDLDWSA